MKTFPRKVCPAHNKAPKFVRNEKAGYAYWQCPEGCWLDIEDIQKSSKVKKEKKVEHAGIGA